MRTMIVAGMLMLSGCAALPWDPDGTTERVRATKVLRSGVIASGNAAPDAALRQFLDLVADEGEPARAVVVRNGENAWVTRVYRHALALKEQPR